MKFDKLVPWNWFKREEEREGSLLPVRRDFDVALPESFARLQREIDRIFDEFARDFALPLARWDRVFAPVARAAEWFKPNVEISATDKEYTVNVELPGVNEKDINVEVSNDTLRISGEKKQEQEEKGKGYYRSERAYGSFERLLTLPEDADADNITAKFKNGVLTVAIPRKVQAQPEAKKIEVKTE
ncbi:MAG: Hsp20/alpha crystallin family protein [Candidatus Sumerlaeaceae bacterium]|jgi:HSP20 family protein